MATFIGFLVAIFSLLVAVAYFAYKLIFWQRFQLGMAPMVIGVFFFTALQLFFIGIIGEYIGAIYTQLKNRRGLNIKYFGEHVDTCLIAEDRKFINDYVVKKMPISGFLKSKRAVNSAW